MERDEVIRPKDLKGVVGISLTTAWRMEKAGEFPKRRKLSRGTVGWLRSELTQWTANREAA